MSLTGQWRSTGADPGIFKRGGGGRAVLFYNFQEFYMIFFSRKVAKKGQFHGLMNLANISNEIGRPIK